MTTATESTAVAEMRRQGDSLAQEIDALVISDQETLEIASGYRQAIKTYLKRATEFMKPILDAATAMVTTARRQRDELLAPGERALAAINGKVAQYDAEQRAKAEAERKRIEAERTRAEEEAKLQAALEAEASGDSRGATAILDSPYPPEPVFTPPPVVQTPKAEGLHMKSLWEAEVVDLRALVHAWLDGQAPAGSIIAHMPPLNALARAHRETLNVPGVRAVEKRIVAGSAG